MDGVFMRITRKFGVFLLASVCLVLLSFGWASCRQTQLASRLLRLHVVANSDSAADQRLKLQVRDAVLERCGIVLAGEQNLSGARARLIMAMPELAQTGADVVRAQGRDYSVRVGLEYVPFPKTEYEGFALPAGTYQALRIELGAGEGHNWWCVLFPNLCLASESELSETAMAQGLTEEDVALLEREGSYEIRFRCVELWEELRTVLRRN